jgi:hypothetical protein
MQCPDCGSRNLSSYGELYLNEETGKTKICFSRAFSIGLLAITVNAACCGLLVLPASLELSFLYFHIAFFFWFLCSKTLNQEAPEGYKKYAELECNVCKSQWRGLWNQPISE